MWEEQEELMSEWVNDCYSGHAAGPAGDRGTENLKHFDGKRIPYSIGVLTKSLREANYMILRTPAAWCMRLPSRVPHTAPCLEPKIQRAIEEGELEVGTDVQVNPEHCQPHLCGDAGHSRSDLNTARRARKWAEKKVANSRGTQAKLDADAELKYWTDVEHRLTHGRSAEASSNEGSS